MDLPKLVAHDLGIAPTRCASISAKSIPESKAETADIVAGTLSITHQWADSIDAETSFMISQLVASSVTMPKFTVPSPSRLTCRPARPTNEYCIYFNSF